jgi:hypothetical protein
MHYLPLTVFRSKDHRSPKSPRGGLLPSANLGLAPLYLYNIGKLRSYVLLYDLVANDLLGLPRRLQSLDAMTALVGAVALCMIGPLRAFAEAHSQVAFASTFALFMVPGILLSHWFIGEYFPGAAIVPVAFVLSVSLFGVLAVPALVLHASLGAYLWVSGVIVFAFLVLLR